MLVFIANQVGIEQFSALSCCCVWASNRHFAPKNATLRCHAPMDYLGLKSSVADMDAHTLRG
jgi:hypothetical protein